MRPDLHRPGLVFTAAITTLMLAPAGAALACQPAVRDLGTLGGGVSSVAEGNNHGWLVGRATDAAGTDRAVLWRGRSSTIVLDVPGGAEQPSIAMDVNDRGTVVGNVGTLGDVRGSRSWVWRHGDADLLPGLPGGGGTLARRINDGGDVVGSALAADGRVHPVRWRDGRIEDIGLPPGVSDGFGFGINEAGAVSGSFQRPEDLDLAFVWRLGALTTFNFGQANLIDDAGRAAGRFDNVVLERSEAGWWAPDGTLHDLGVLSAQSPDAYGWIFTTDGEGDWGGSSAAADGTPTAFVSRPVGPLLALPGLDGRYGSASDVHALDRRGNAAGSSTTVSGKRHATLWQCAFAQARPL